MKKFTFLFLMAIIAMTTRAYSTYTNIEIGNFKYNLFLASSSSEESCAYLLGLSSAGASATSLTISGYVIFNNNRYRVTRITNNAF